MEGDEDDGFVICKCCLCNSSLVPLGTKRQHMRMYNDAKLTSKISLLDTKADSGPSLEADPTCAVDDEGRQTSLDNDVFRMTLVTDALQKVEDEGDPKDAPTTSSDQAVFERILQIDNKYRWHLKTVEQYIFDMDNAVQQCDADAICNTKPALMAYQDILQALLKELHSVDVLGDESHQLWKTSLLELIGQLLEKLLSSEYVGASWSLEGLDPERTIVNTDEYLGRHVHAMNPLILIPILLVISLNLFAHVSREWCNSSLRVLRLYAKFAVTGLEHWEKNNNGQPVAFPKTSPPPRKNSTPFSLEADDRHSDHQKLLEEFPVDLRTLMDRFGMQGKIDIYAVCPDSRCCAVYAPVIGEDGRKSYPRICMKKHFRRPDGYRKAEEIECGTLLSVDGVPNDKTSSRVPIKSFPVQDWDHFKARMIANPLILTLLRRGMSCVVKDEMHDIKDGSLLASLTDKDGNPFLTGNNGELRLAWSFSTDWFNPFHDVNAGKSASVGSIAMTCLNLPPTFRYKPEYVFLAGVIPGAEEPKDDLVNNFLDVIVDRLERSYAHGTQYSTTYIFPQGIVERSIVAVFVFDLPAARKCCGMHSYSSKRNFCHICQLPLSDINNLNVGSWPLRDYDKHKTDALAWKAETNKKKRETKFSETGVRWSPFLRLPYFHPHRTVVIDGMHNLFLGLCMYHVREFLGIDEKAEQKNRKYNAQVNINQLAKARAKLNEDPRKETIKSFSVPILRALCYEEDVSMDADGLEARPKDMRKALLKAKMKPKCSAGLGGFDFTEKLIGDDYFDNVDPIRVIGKITAEELKQIRSYIASTERPRWHKSPPRNLGEARHGKLKADQWRSLMEFDLPVALAQLWDGGSERRQLFHCTMLLAIAMRYATSHVMTKRHIEKYKTNMLEYLVLLRKIDPKSNLRPNHHESLHMPDFLEFFGPMHGWWAFVYERVIGLLQNTNTNYKIGGQMERTMMESFCAAANFRGFLKRADLPDIVREVANAIDFPEEIRGTLLQSAHGVSGETASMKISRTERERKKLARLEDDVIGALTKVAGEISALTNGKCSPPFQAVRHDRVIIQGKTFSVDKTTNSMGHICIHNGSVYVPGRLRDILSITYPDASNDQSLNIAFIFVVHQHLPASSKVSNPFLDYAEFGASLWSKKCYDRPSAVPVYPSSRFCHGILRDWDDKHIVVKSLDREFILFNE